MSGERARWGAATGLLDSRGRLSRIIRSRFPPFSSIEWRFDGTTAEVRNNLLSHNLRDRGATLVLTDGNIEQAPASLVLDADAGELHLAPGSWAVDAGVPLAEGVADEDIDGDLRDDGSPDVGADEFVE